MTPPMRPARVLQPTVPPPRETEPEAPRPLASEQRRLDAIGDQKLEDALEAEAKVMLTLMCEKMSDRVNRFKAISMFLAVKHKLGPVFGGALDGDGDEA